MSEDNEELKRLWIKLKHELAEVKRGGTLDSARLEMNWSRRRRSWKRSLRRWG